MLPLEITPAQNSRQWSSFSTATGFLNIYPSVKKSTEENFRVANWIGTTFLQTIDLKRHVVDHPWGRPFVKTVRSYSSRLLLFCLS